MWVGFSDVVEAAGESMVPVWVPSCVHTHIIRYALLLDTHRFIRRACSHPTLPIENPAQKQIENTSLDT
jgi:hypothetical protein